MLLHTPSRGLFSAKLSHFWAPDKRGKQKKRKSKSLCPVCTVSKFRLGPNILNITQNSQLVQGKRDRNSNYRQSSEGLIWTEMKMRNNKNSKTALGVIFCSSHLGLAFWDWNKWVLLTFPWFLWSCLHSGPAWGSHLGFQFVKMEPRSAKLRAAPAAEKNGMKFKPDPSVPPAGEWNLQQNNLHVETQLLHHIPAPFRAAGTSTAQQSWFVPCWATCPCPGSSPTPVETGNFPGTGNFLGTGNQPCCPPRLCHTFTPAQAGC